MIEDTVSFRVAKDNLFELSKFVREAQQLLSPDYVAVFWHISDVQERWEITSTQAREVLQKISGRHHDATMGINWDVIDAAVDALFPDAIRNRSSDDEDC
jgi:hypothetical protein